MHPSYVEVTRAEAVATGSAQVVEKNENIYNISNVARERERYNSGSTEAWLVACDWRRVPLFIRQLFLNHSLLKAESMDY